MARTLPWLLSANSTARPSATKRNKIASDEEVSDHATSRHGRSTARSMHRTRTAARHNSSSPPPAPPEEVPMIEGMDADDRYIMVEDEQYATARLFTRHLHQAEYLRQKQLARSRNEGNILNIERPVDGRTMQSTAVVKKLQASRQAQRVKAAVKNITGTDGTRSDAEEDDPWLRDPRLAGLMSQKEPSLKLTKITGSQSSSRAAQGFSQGRPSPKKQTKYTMINDESDTTIVHDRGTLSAPSDSRRKSFMDSVSEDLDKVSFRSKYPKISSDRLPHRPSTEHRDADTRFDDLEDDDMGDAFPLPRYKPSERRPVARTQAFKKETGEDKPVKVEEVPTFLF